MSAAAAAVVVRAQASFTLHEIASVRLRMIDSINRIVDRELRREVTLKFGCVANSGDRSDFSARNAALSVRRKANGSKLSSSICEKTTKIPFKCPGLRHAMSQYKWHRQVDHYDE